MLRTRTKGAIDSPLHYEITQFPASCANRVTVPYADYTFGVPVVSQGEKKTTVDEVAIGYWKRKKRGDIIVNGFYSYTQSRKLLGSADMTQTSYADVCFSPNIKSVYKHSKAAGTYYYHTLVSPLTGGPQGLLGTNELDRLRAEVTTKCLANRQSGAANYVESLAEIDKTFAMLRHPLENVQRFVRDFRRHGKRKNTIKRTRGQANDLIVFVSAEWLRFRYGITPLMNDVKAGIKALKKVRDEMPVRIVRSRANGSIVTNGTTSPTGSTTYIQLSYLVSRADQFSCRAVFYDKYVPNIFDELGLTLHNLVAVPWELTKLSFVVDWFVNIGDMIYANIPRVTLEPQVGALTTRRIVTQNVQCVLVTDLNPTDSWVFTGSCGDSYLMTDITTQRTSFGAYDSKLSLKSDFKLDEWVRCMDASTLLLQLLSSISFEKH